MDNIAVITWPPGRPSLMARMLEICLGEVWTALVAKATALNAPIDGTAAKPIGYAALPQCDDRRYLIEYEHFPLAAVIRYKGFVTKGGEDSALGFRRFASDDYSRHEAFAARWIATDYAENQLLIDAAELRAHSKAWLLWALSHVAPVTIVSDDLIAKALECAASWPVASRLPEETTFAYYDKALFDLLASIKLSRHVVVNTFQDILDRAPEEATILDFQQVAHRDVLERNLRNSKEFKLRANTPLPALGAHAKRTAEEVLTAEFKRYERRRKNNLGWPLTQVFISQKSNVMYCPIGKVACTFLKRLMVQISEVGHPDLLIKDVHGLTDNIRTGLQLGDYPMDTAQAMMIDPKFFKFAVMRAPRDRLLSAYIEKFVIERNSPGNLFHTMPVITSAQRRQGYSTIDPNIGISFRQFICEITALPSHRLDTHWRPQVDYLQGIQYDQIYSFDQINDVVDMLEQRSGMSLPRQPANVTGSGTGGATHPNAPDLLPADIIGLPKLDKACFFDNTLAAMITDYFSADVALLRATTNEVII
jgi:hypothetical protein